MKVDPNKLIAEYKTELARANGQQYADATTIWYNKGWFHVKKNFETTFRKEQLAQAIDRLKKHPTSVP